MARTLQQPSHRRRRTNLPTVLGAGATALAVAGTGLALFAGGASAAVGNLVGNGGFESGLSGWTCTGTAVAGAPAHSGAAALNATPSASDTAECRQTVSVLPNSSYTLAGWVQGPYVYLGATGTGGADPSTWSSQSSWNQLSTTFTTGAGTTSVTLYVHGWYGQAAYGADDITLTGPGGTSSPSPSPSASSSAPASPSPSASASSSAPASPSPSASSSAPTSPSPTATTTPPATGLPKHALTGYWQNFDNGATVQRLRDVQSAYDIIAVSFADATTTAGGISFTLDPALASKLGGYGDADFKADIAAKHAAGKKVVLSIGGQNGTIVVNNSAAANTFANTAYALIQQYGFDGVDIDLENGVDPVYMAQSLHTLQSKVGSGFILTMAPETIGMYSTAGNYFQLALNTKDILTVVNTQFYNSGGMNGCDGKVYTQGTIDFITAQVCTHIQGGLRPDQVGIGVPASTRAAGGGYVNSTVVDNALDCLATGTHCGSFVPPAKWPTIRGAMTWSTNWDAANGNDFSTNVGAHAHAMP
ncbi:glycosyl hydrolase family 18 protein [Kitasatospora sp. NPDC048540]|uniref:chitinase n=1 Tax=Kitasatospora sp. NPDC048540 TaxID=3155634 RepID=UPI0033CBAF8B